MSSAQHICKRQVQRPEGRGHQKKLDETQISQISVLRFVHRRNSEPHKRGKTSQALASGAATSGTMHFVRLATSATSVLSLLYNVECPFAPLLLPSFLHLLSSYLSTEKQLNAMSTRSALLLLASLFFTCAKAQSEVCSLPYRSPIRADSFVDHSRHRLRNVTLRAIPPVSRFAWSASLFTVFQE